MPISFLYLQKRFGAGQGSFLGHGSEKKLYSLSEDSPQGEWDKMAEKMWLTFAESQSSVPRVHCPEVSLRAKAVENCRSTIKPTKKRLKLFFAQLFISLVFTEQSQMCREEYVTLPDRTGHPLWEGCGRAVVFLIRA